ncbi:MAG: enoyl-CoA hydratase/isomerase family protein [Sinobacteraceae bacterium]|nr:enoyl-CoA hydratase/isomerase family protein [Nevskiaceae bacterium]
MSATGAWSIETDVDGIAWLTIDKPGTSANVLSSFILAELDGLLGPLRSAPPRAVIVISGKKSGFIAGADIKEFTAIRDLEQGYRLIRTGQDVLSRLESLPCPTVAAVHGFALGGGLELALACRYRVAVEDERLSLGLPEVQLGIHPGFGGTVRAVRLLGVRPAMQMMLTGKPVRAEKALRLGLVDRLTSAAELRSAARQLALAPPAVRRAPFAEQALSWAPVRPFVKRTLIAQVAAKARREHYPAPYAIIDLWAAGGKSYEAEARSIAQLFLSSSSRNLVRVFLLQDRLKALGGKGGADIRHVHVVGAGVMGGDIAAWAALRGCNVTLQDRSAELVQPAIQRAGDLFRKRLRGAEKVAAAVGRLKADVAGDGVAQADVVIEAIFENLQAKRELYARLEPRMKPTALLGTNTSSLLLEPLAAQLARPEQLVGLHFFNPVAQMPLLEIVRSGRTGEACMQSAVSFARKLDKLPLPCRSAPGFVVNRVLMPYLHEAMFAAQEGVPLALIDRTAVDFGMPMGPIELADVVGLDVAAHVGEIIAQELERSPPDLRDLKQRVAAGKLGRKSGVGFYSWQHGKPVKAAVSATTPADLQDRLILVLVNECIACYREQIAADADLIDAAVIFGTGFAPFRGGPLQYARERGPQAVVQRLEELASRYGERFRPDAGWAQFAAAAKE